MRCLLLSCIGLEQTFGTVDGTTVFEVCSSDLAKALEELHVSRIYNFVSRLVFRPMTSNGCRSSSADQAGFGLGTTNPQHGDG